jgi:hypothetical protein
MELNSIENVTNGSPSQFKNNYYYKNNQSLCHDSPISRAKEVKQKVGISIETSP